MKITRRAASSILLTVLFMIVLFLLNRDIFTFEYHDPLERNFLPEKDAKGFYFLGESILLKPGNYDLIFTGELPKNGSEISLIASDDFILYNKEFENTEEPVFLKFSITGQAQNIRIRLNYDPESGPISIQHIVITGDHVLYKDSVIRHGISSLFCGMVYLFVLLRIQNPDLIFRLIPFLSDPKNEQSLFLLFLLSILVSFPLLQKGIYFAGGDTAFHLSRLHGIAADLKAGIFPPRIELFWLDDIGYGIGFFYPEIFLVLPACFLLSGFSMFTIHYILWIVIVFLTLLTHFLSAKTISGGSHKAGVSAAIFIACAIYRLQNQYNRDGLGEAFAFIFLPLIAVGLYQVFQRKSNCWIILAIGFTGTLLSHMISFVLAVFFTAVFLLTQIQKILKDRKILLDFVKAAFLSIGLSAFFLFPMLEQKYAVPNLKINQVTSGKLDMSYATMTQSLSDIFLFFLPDNAADRVPFYPGWALLIVPFLGIYLVIKKEKNIHAANLMSAAAVLILIASTELFPWHLVQYFLNDIQFTWRLIQSAVVLLSLAGGIYINLLCKKRLAIPVFLIQLLICLVPAIMMIFSIRENRLRNSNDFYMQNHFTYGSEYMPPDLSRKYIKEMINVVVDNNGDAKFYNFKRNALSVDFDFSENNSEKLDFTVPFLYYKGYSAEIIYPDGKTERALATAATENGFVHVCGTGTESGHIHVWYKNTGIQIFSDWISFLTVILCLFFFENHYRIRS